jgi:hypothetical protein
VTYLRLTLSALGAVIVALLGPTVVRAFQTVESSRATGLAAVVGGALESIFTPLFWILAISLFALFFGASRFSNKPLRTLLFWIPVTTISALGCCIFAFFGFAMLYIRNR